MLKDRDIVVVVTTARSHIAEVRRVAVHRKDIRSEHGPLDAMRAVLADRLQSREARVVLGFVVHRDGVEKVLDQRRRGEAHEQRQLGGGEARGPARRRAGAHIGEVGEARAERVRGLGPDTAVDAILFGADAELVGLTWPRAVKSFSRTSV